MRPPAPEPKVTLPETVNAFADILFTTTLPPVIVPVAVRLPKNPA